MKKNRQLLNVSTGLYKGKWEYNLDIKKIKLKKFFYLYFTVLDEYNFNIFHHSIGIIPFEENKSNKEIVLLKLFP